MHQIKKKKDSNHGWFSKLYKLLNGYEVWFLILRG